MRKKERAVEGDCRGVSRRAVLAGGPALLAGCAGRAPALPMDDLPHAGIARMGAGELAEGYRSRLLSPVEVARKLIERMEASQGTVNAFAHIDRETTLAAARAAEQRHLKGAPLGPLDGVPVSFKDADEFALQGWPIAYGSAAIDARTALAKADSPLVARLRGQGLVPLGITTAPDFYQCVCSTSSRTGVTRNPWNLAYGAGGSSSGAGAAAAAGLGPLHLGTDGGGSVRTPAAWCGVVGLCIGVEFSGYPVGLPGILARSVADVALLAGVMGGEAASAEGRRWPAADYAGALGLATLKGQRIAAWPEPSPVGVAVSADVGAVVQAAIDRVGRDAGGLAPPLPTLLDRAALVDGWTAGIAETLRQTGRMIPEARRKLADPWLLTQVARAEAIPDATLAPMPGRYEPMIAAVAADPRLAALDIVLMPTMPVGPQAAERQVPAGYDDTVIPYGLDDGGRLLGHTSMFSLLGWASASIPCGFDANGLPVGLMVGVRPGPDDLLRCLQAAQRIEALVAPPQGRRPFS